MSNLWLLLSSLLIIIVSSTLVMSIELGISPPSLNFSMRIGEGRCEKVNLYSQGVTNIKIKDTWTNGSRLSRDLNDYNYNSNELGINTVYPKVLAVDKKEEFLLCITGSRSGNYQGVLIAEGEGILSVGMWILADIKSEKKTLLTGKFVEGKDITGGMAIGLYTMSLLMIVFMLLLSKLVTDT